MNLSAVTSRLKCSAVAILILISTGGSTFAQLFDFSYPRKRESTSFHFINNLIIITLTINGSGPYNFVLDTGVGLFLISDPSLVTIFPESSLRSIKINGLGEGSEMTALIYPAANIHIGNSIKGKIPVAILQEDPFNLSSFVGMPIHGLIGYELFQSFIIRINYGQKTVTYYKPETAVVPRKGIRIPISIEERKPYIYTTLKLHNDKREVAKLIIDTGAGHPISLETKDGEPYTTPEKSIRANLGVGLSGMINGFVGRIRLLNLGKFQLDNLICAFPDHENAAAKTSSIKRNGNLGNYVLKRFNVVFDYRRESMYVKPNYMFKEPFEHDMSGMEITTEGADFSQIVVMRVEPGSAAERIGLKRGDRILSVNFKPVKLMGIEEINSLFRSKNGRNIVLEILPHQSEDSKFSIITLKRRI